MPDSAHPGRRLRPPLAVSGLAVVALLALSSCASGGSGQGAGTGTAGAGEPVAVATTTQLGSVLADITACAGTSSATLMGPGDDPHDFSPSSQQIAAMARSGLVVANGLGLESGMQSALDNAQADGATLLEVGPALDPLPLGGDEALADEGAHEHDGHDHSAEGSEHAGGHGHDHGDEDPHVWMDVSRMATAAGVIGDALAEATGDEAYAGCGQEAATALEATDQEVRDVLAAIPDDRRTLVTDHAAYGYFADAYGLEVAGVVVPGGSTDAEPSSERLAGLVRQMDEAGADALVMSAGSGNKLIGALAAETGGEVPVVELYEGGVGPEGSGAEDYAEAMVSNARALADALS